MVRAAKAHRLVQQGCPKEVPQVDAQFLLDSFEGWIGRGLPDEALLTAVTAFDIFCKNGDKAGEYAALARVEKAILQGANRDVILNSGSIALQKASTSLFSGESTSQVADLAQLGQTSLNSDSIPVDQEPGDSTEVRLLEEASSSACTDLTELPISYGEMLILKTCIKSRERPYDRERQDFLARPRRLSTSITLPTRDSSTSAGDPSYQSQRPSEEHKPLSSAATADLVSRLTQPKKLKNKTRPPGEQVVLRSEEVSRDKNMGFDVSAMVSRLSTPRTARAMSPSPGERIVLMWNRPEHARRPNPQRMNELAISTRRGGSARAWGIYPSMAATSQAATSSPDTSPVQAAPAPPPKRPPGTITAAPRPRPAPGTVSRESSPSKAHGGDSRSPRAEKPDAQARRLEDERKAKQRSMLQDESSEQYSLDDLLEDLDLSGVDLPGLDGPGSPQSQGQGRERVVLQSWRSNGIDRRM